MTQLYWIMSKEGRSKRNGLHNTCSSSLLGSFKFSNSGLVTHRSSRIGGHNGKAKRNPRNNRRCPSWAVRSSGIKAGIYHVGLAGSQDPRAW